MRTDAPHHGHASGARGPTIGKNAPATTAAPTEIKTVVANGSSPPLIVAFQPAGQAAATNTAAKTIGSMGRIRGPGTNPCLNPGTPLPAIPSARRAGTGWGGEPRRRVHSPPASPNGGRRAWREPARPYRPSLRR